MSEARERAESPLRGSDTPLRENAVDVRQLMREVRRRVGRQVVEVDDYVQPGTAPLRTLRDSFDLLSVPIESPRRGIGPVVATLKRGLARMLVSVLHRQTTFNSAATRILGGVSTRIMHFDTEIERLERRMVALDERVKERLDAVGARLARAEQRGLTAAPGPGGAPPPSTLPAAEPERFEQFAMQGHFRGSEHEIKRRQSVYLEHFIGHGPVLDVGSGRGEFLELLRESGVPARGVEGDIESVLHCRAKGLEIEHADAFEYLESLPDGSLGGIFCAQVIEHFRPSQVLRFTKLCARKLRRDGIALFETPNPQCVSVFAQAFYMDFTHVWPYHPDVMKFVLEAAGFGDVQTLFSSPLDPAARLPELRNASVFGPETDAYNRAAALVNKLLLGFQDYAVIGRKQDEVV